jgi:hypothetical protein
MEPIETIDRTPPEPSMKLLGLLLLVAGWAITLAAVVLLKTTPERSVFAIAGVGVEVLGLILAFRAHQPPKGESE